MSRHPQICTVHYVSQWGMMIGILELMISCMKGQGIYTKFKANYSKKEASCSIIPQEEETSILAVDSEDEEEEEVWVEVEDRSSVITAHNQDTWKGTERTLVPLEATTTHSNMS
jgi:hypothetical protein